MSSRGAISESEDQISWFGRVEARSSLKDVGKARHGSVWICVFCGIAGVLVG